LLGGGSFYWNYTNIAILSFVTESTHLKKVGKKLLLGSDSFYWNYTNTAIFSFVTESNHLKK